MAKIAQTFRPTKCSFKELFRKIGVTGLPDNFPIQKKIGCFCKALFLIYFKTLPRLLLNGKVIWRASDSSLSKELHSNLKQSIQANAFSNTKNQYTHFLMHVHTLPYKILT